MMKIAITDNHQEMEQIGERIIQEKSAIYTPAMVRTLTESIARNMPAASEQERHRALLRSVYDYWVYGNNYDEEFYFGYADKTHEEKLQYITFRIREKYCGYLNKDGDPNLFINKYNTYLKFKKYYLRDVIQIQSDADYDCFLAFIRKHPTFVVKPQDMAFGVGVYLVKETDYTDPKELFRSIRESGRRTKEDVVWAKSDAIVLEELIEQDPSVGAFHPYSVNSVRVTTIKVNDEVVIYHPWFKIGVDGQFVTSAMCGTMDAGINPETGVVETNGIKQNGESLEYHPNTGLRIPGFVIPRWDELVKTAKEVAEAVEGLRYVGWDFVLTPKGWCIMEGNYDGWFMWQLIYQKGMRQEFEELIGWKYDKTFWWE